jgi:hypothetical protein
MAQETALTPRRKDSEGPAPWDPDIPEIEDPEILFLLDPDTPAVLDPEDTERLLNGSLQIEPKR